MNWKAMGATMVAILAVAAAGAGTATASPLLVSPRAGEIVRGDLARLEIRGAGRLVQARLNGVRVAGEFGPRRRGVRGMTASISQGLRPGGNVLRVVVKGDDRRRRATVRFAVRPDGLMVGAGRDVEAGVGGVVRLSGEVGSGGTARGARWKLIDAPPARGSDSGGPGADLSSPAGLSAGFHPTRLGEYTLALAAGGSSDLVEIEVLPRNKLVPIETMAAPGSNADAGGIRVGGVDFLLRDAEQRGGGEATRLQVVVLERANLEFVSNRRYSSAASLADDLAKVGDDKLVIVASQPDGTGYPYFDRSERPALGKALSSIGAPDYGDGLPLSNGSISVIGVPGMPPGTADVDVLPERAGNEARLTGYLTPDQHRNFGFVPSLSIPFALPAKPAPPVCTDACEWKVGFQLKVLNGRGGGVLKDEFFYTYRGEDEAVRLGRTLEGIAPDDVVELEARSVKEEGKSEYMPLFGTVGKVALVRIANAIARLGGTRNGFNRVILHDGKLGSGIAYELVGWKGAKEGEGIELAEGVDGANPVNGISGVLRPDLQSRLRPAAATPAKAGPGLAGYVLRAPTSKWPDEGKPAVGAAISYLGSRFKVLGPDPRSAFWKQSLEPSRWRELGNEVKAIEYGSVPAERRQGFSEADFKEGRTELFEELHWVGDVREYLAKLATPFDESKFKGWTEAKTIADRIYKEVSAPDDRTDFELAEFISVFMKVSGPLTGGVTASIGASIDLGIWAWGANGNGAPSGIEFQIAGDEVGKNLAEGMESTAKTFDRMGDVIVSDPDKLKYVGENALCNPGDGCAEGFSFPDAAADTVTADLDRSIQRFSYETLLPLGFHVFQLNPYPGLPTAPPNPRQYYCGFWPWYYYSDPAIQYGTVDLLQELDPAKDTESTWQVLALSRGEYRITQKRGDPPSDEMLRRMFTPVPAPGSGNALNPNAGGLGISPAELMRSIKPRRWLPIDAREPDIEKTLDACRWEG